MAELTIRLEVDPQTGRKQILVGYESDPDALPMEHEDDHQAIIDALIDRGLVGPGGQVIIERGEKRDLVEIPASEADAEAVAEEA